MQLLRGSFALVISACLIGPPAPAIGETRAASPPKQPSGTLEGDARILHALNRFTFGPRSGDLETVRATGLDRWFEQQLHPERIADPSLRSRLEQFPALQLNSQDLLHRLPSNAIIRQAAEGKISIPSDALLRAIYENQIARVAQRRQEKQQATADTKPSAQAAMNSMSNEGAASQTGETMRLSEVPPDSTVEPAFVAEVLDLSPQQRLDRLILLDQREFDSFRKSLKAPQRAALASGMNPAQKEQLAALENPQRTVVDELTSQRLARDIYSNAQLQEVMTDFWLNHFNVFLHKNEETPYYLVSYERDVIRPRALGKFEDLLEATAHSPAMLLYLDNASSMGPDSLAAERAKLAAERHPVAPKKASEGLNENYARELMELHTLGVNGGYTQEDVTQVARILTGWTVDRPQRGGSFRFDENRHEPGTKKVLGKKFKEHGEQEGRDLLHMLATRPATARFLSRKLAIRFVGDDPPQQLIDRMAKSYLSSGGDVSAVLRTLFHSPEFWSNAAFRDKVKTPLEYVASAARAADAEIENYQPLLNALRDLGMPLYGCVPPTGYNWQASKWISTGALVSRMNFALAMAANRLPGVTVHSVFAQDTSPGAIPPPEPEEQRLERLLVAGGVGDSTRSAVLEQFRAQSAQPQQQPRPLAASAKNNRPNNAPSVLERQDQLLAGLLLGSPEFQRR